MLLLQGSNFLVPIVLIPLLLSRIGLENYGVVSLAQSIMILLTTFGEFGYNLTGTRLVSQNRENRLFIKGLSGQILISRSFAQIVGLTLLTGAVFIIPSWRIHAFMILSSYLMVIGQAHLPVWYFQGMQRVKDLMLLNLASRVLYILLVVALIQKPEDYIWVNLLNGGAMILVSLCAWLQIWRQVGIRFKFNWHELVKSGATNSSILLSNFIGDLYRSIAMILAGFLLSPSSLGLYSVFDKVIQLVQNGFASISWSLFPRVSAMVASNRPGIKVLFRKYYLTFCLPVIICSITILLFGGDLMALASKDIFVSAVRPFQPGLALVPLLFFIGVPPSISLMAFDLKASLLLFNLSSLIIHSVFSILFIPEFGIQGILISFTCSQIFPILYAVIELKRKGIQLV